MRSLAAKQEITSFLIRPGSDRCRQLKELVPHDSVRQRFANRKIRAHPFILRNATALTG